MVFSSVVVHALKSPPNSVMPPLEFELQHVAKFWNKDLFLCLEPIGVTYTMQINKLGAAPLLTHSHR
jgi:hypothetical protein